MSTIGTELVSIDFYGDTIDAVQLQDDSILVSVKRICESLGMDFSSQLQKLKSTHWACVAIIAIHDTSGRVQDICVIPSDSIPLWMVTIHPGKVDERIREKLRRYQTEAKDVLAKHFMPKTALVRQPTAAEIDRMTSEDLLSLVRSIGRNLEVQIEQGRRIAATEVKVIEVEARTVQVEARALEATVKADAASAKADEVLTIVNGKIGYMTVRGFCNVNHLSLSDHEMSTVGRMLSRQCRLAGIAIKDIPDESYGSIHSYPMDVLEKWRDSRLVATR